MSDKRELQRQALIDETARLLRRIHFSHAYGDYAESDAVAVSIDPRWNSGHDTFRALLSCMAFGHRQVEWEHLPVQVTPEGRGDGVHALIRLDAGGHGLIPRLPPGDYRLMLRAKLLRSVPVLAPRLDRLAAQGDEEEERRVRQGEGEDGAVQWSLEETEDGDMQVAFETQDERLAHASVLFHLLDATSKQVCYSRQLSFTPTRSPGKWEAWCSIGVREEFPGPYDLVFEIVLPDVAP